MSCATKRSKLAGYGRRGDAHPRFHYLAVWLVALNLVGACSLGGDVADTPANGSVDAAEVGAVTGVTSLDSSERSDFVSGMVADGTVSATELSEAYNAFIECLVESGGSGTYAYDLEVDLGIALDWAVDDDDQAGSKLDAIDRSCRAEFIGNAEDVFLETGWNPAGFELARERIMACLFNAGLVSVVGVEDGLSYDEINAKISEAQPTLSISESQTAIDCSFSALRGQWRSFGN